MAAKTEAKTLAFSVPAKWHQDVQCGVQRRFFSQNRFPGSGPPARPDARGCFLPRGRTLYVPILNFSSFSSACPGPSRWQHGPLLCHTPLPILCPQQACRSVRSSSSLTKMLNRTGRSIYPRGTLLITGLQPDFVPLTWLVH